MRKRTRKVVKSICAWEECGKVFYHWENERRKYHTTACEKMADTQWRIKMRDKKFA